MARDSPESDPPEHDYRYSSEDIGDFLEGQQVFDEAFAPGTLQNQLAELMEVLRLTEDVVTDKEYSRRARSSAAKHADKMRAEALALAERIMAERQDKGTAEKRNSQKRRTKKRRGAASARSAHRKRSGLAKGTRSARPRSRGGARCTRRT